MLAYLIDDQPTIHAPAALDVTLAVPARDDQGLRARGAYEVAQQLDAERWTPRRWHRPNACRCEALA
jgi:hypothetical protein